ncbi:OmpA family protein [Luteibacter sp.]|jgi:outer membrane protein OmpA-like peptidoglycan-associated protein|uniref:OmpA family protein n=1 Tax=Luteibacter sp. TaxID=1886636 RepID=UPI002F3FDAFC
MRQLTRDLLVIASSAALACGVGAVWLHGHHMAYWSGVTAVLVATMLLAWWRVHRHRRARRAAASLFASNDADAWPGFRPSSAARCLVVIGEGLPELFDRNGTARRQRLEQGAWWHRVDDPGQLTECIDALRHLCGRQIDGVVIALLPSRHAGMDDLAEAARRLQRAVEDAGRRLGRRIPSHLVLYHRWGQDMAGVLSCRGVVFDAASPSVDGLNALRAGVEADGRRDPGAGGYGAARFDALLRCSASLAAANKGFPHALAWVDAGTASGGRDAAGRWIASATGVTPGHLAASVTPWPLPHAMADHLPRPPRIASVPQSLAWLTALCGVALALAWAGSARNNLRWLRHDHADLVRYAQTPTQAFAAREAALTALLDDRKRLDRHRLVGVPLALGLGMYRDHAVRAALDRTIASHVPPPAPPVLVSLDAMSLFESGSAALRTGSSRLLVKALADIGRHPDKRILVAGHTDDTGDAEANRRLSLARAAAVRDWLIEASGIAAERFATQGYGELRPLGDNRTTEGRARNRRVEISLVAEATSP